MDKFSLRLCEDVHHRQTQIDSFHFFISVLNLIQYLHAAEIAAYVCYMDRRDRSVGALGPAGFDAACCTGTGAQHNNALGAKVRASLLG